MAILRVYYKIFINQRGWDLKQETSPSHVVNQSLNPNWKMCTHSVPNHISNIIAYNG